MAIIVVGDHGFADIHEVFRPNMLIQGLPARFIASGGSAFPYRQDQVTATDSLVRAVSERMAQVPEEKRKLFRIIYRRELDPMGADSGAVLALAAVPGLVFSGAVAKASVANHGPGTLIQQSPLEGVFVPTHGGHHGYDPDMPEMWTGFIACRAGIIKGGHIKGLSEPDIAVLVTRLLGIDFKTPDGKVVEGIMAKP